MPVAPMDVEQVAGVAEGVGEGDRRGGRIDAERDAPDPLPAVLARVQAEHHQAALRGLPVAELGEVLDQEAPWRVLAHGVSSIS